MYAPHYCSFPPPVTYASRSSMLRTRQRDLPSMVEVRNGRPASPKLEGIWAVLWRSYPALEHTYPGYVWHIGEYLHNVPTLLTAFSNRCSLNIDNITTPLRSGGKPSSPSPPDVDLVCTHGGQLFFTYFIHHKICHFECTFGFNKHESQQGMRKGMRAGEEAGAHEEDR